MPRFALLAATALLATATAVAQPSSLAPDRGRRRRRRHRQGRRARRRLRSSTPMAAGASRTEIPADRSSIGSFLTAALLVEQRNIEIITGAGQRQSGRRQRRAPDRRLLCRLSRPRRDRRARRRAAPAGPRRGSHAIADRRDALRRARRHRCAPTSIRSTRPTSGPRICSACSSPRACSEPDRNLRLSAAGRPRPARPRLLPLRHAGDDPGPRRLSRLYRQMLTLMGVPDAEARAAAHLRPRDQDRPRPCRRGRRAGPARRADLGAAPTSRPARPGSTGTPSSTPPSSAAQDEIVA